MEEASVITQAVHGSMSGSRVGASAPLDRFKKEQVASAPGEKSEMDLDRTIAVLHAHRERDGGLTAAQREEQRYRQQCARRDSQIREQNRAAWVSFHQAQADRWRRTLEDMVSHHEAQAQRYQSLAPLVGA